MSHWHPNHWYDVAEGATIIASSGAVGPSFGLLPLTVTAHDATNIVLQRVRDPASRAHSRTFVRMLLTHMQTLVNAKYALVLGQATIITEPYRQFYPLHALVPQLIRVTAVREDGRDLVRTDWKEFWYLSRDWARRTGARIASYATVGRDLLVLHPALRGAGAVDVVYARTLTPLTSEQTHLEIPDDMLPLVYDLTEAALILKSRTYGPMERLTEALQARLGAA